ncbi:uncharacterized protein LOC62_04G006423 [Vanrija pseudolonga]|uniref:Uncharacterized protein n=1 Tax=Vanrija pseudolonga TaxID=143232 RepID=A0AAF0YG88_9TREE|nr:hypothetical protein LOC62_04G006423 [Vanrija pseudolonga]
MTSSSGVKGMSSWTYRPPADAPARVSIVAEAPSTALNWDTTAQRAERKRAGIDPLGPLRKACRRPGHLSAVAELTTVDEFTAFMEAIDRCSIDSIAVRLERGGGLFDNGDMFAAVFVDLLDIDLCKLIIWCKTASLPLNHLDHSIPAIARYLTRPRTTQLQQLGVMGCTGSLAATGMMKLHNRFEGGLWEERLYGMGTSAGEQIMQYGSANVSPQPEVRHTVLRSLVVARMLLFAKPTQRTGIASLPTELIRDIVQQSAPYTNALTSTQWRVLFGHAEDRAAFKAIAREVRVREKRRGFTLVSILEPSIATEWLYNGGFLAQVDMARMAELGDTDSWLDLR